MPTYQYSCTACGSALEAQQSFSDEPLTVCPECGGRLRKIFSAVGVVFKGSGFYRNDSRVSQNGDGAKSTSSSDSDSSSSSKSTSDSGSSSSSGSSGSSGSSSSSGSKKTAKAGSSA